MRITGGSESGKSPTAENVICAILAQTVGACDFYDPMFESVKNHRSIPATGRSHADSVQGLKAYQAKMESIPSNSLYLAWFDEIDTTLDENPKSSSDLKAVLKQSSHKNSGLVITGQNANVRNLKGGFAWRVINLPTFQPSQVVPKKHQVKIRLNRTYLSASRG